MDEDKFESEVKHPQAPPPFVEVECRSSHKILRFSSGTEAGFAVNLINKRLLNNNDGDGVENIMLASHIEAVKEGEVEPVSFGPNSVLVKYGLDWKLQTVLHSYGDKGGMDVKPTKVQNVSAKEGLTDSHSTRTTPQSPIGFVYVGKILLAFILMIVFGAVFTMALENLPRFILYINSSV